MLFVLGLMTCFFSVIAFFYSLIFALLVAALSCSGFNRGSEGCPGWWIGMPFVLVSVSLIVTGCLEVFGGSGVCCNCSKSCRKVILTACIALRGLVLLMFAGIVVLIANWGSLNTQTWPSSPPNAPPWMPGAMPPLPPPSPGYPPCAQRRPCEPARLGFLPHVHEPRLLLTASSLAPLLVRQMVTLATTDVAELAAKPAFVASIAFLSTRRALLPNE